MGRRFFSLIPLVIPIPLLAIYAPIPEEEQGQLLTVQLDTGARYDSNIFGGPNNEYDSFIWLIAPSGQLNYSAGDQVFFQGSYRVEANVFEDRPSEDTLYNHQAIGVFDYQYSERLVFNVSNQFQMIDNPESVLVTGVEILQADQSFMDNRLSTSAQYSFSEKFSTNISAEWYGINYDNDVLARIVDRRDETYSGQLIYSIVPELSWIGELRYEDIQYDVNDQNKGSDSLFYLVGLDYFYGEKLLLQARTGLERRDRNFSNDRESFYGNVAAVYRYLPESILTFGLSRDIGEASNTNNFKDSQSNGLFVTIQHDLTGNGRLYAGGALIYNDATLDGRESLGQPDINEETVRLGFSLIYKWKPGWKAVLSYDLDVIDSEDPFREQRRDRVELFFSMKFGAIQ